MRNVAEARLARTAVGFSALPGKNCPVGNWEILSPHGDGREGVHLAWRAICNIQYV